MKKQPTMSSTVACGSLLLLWPIADDVLQDLADDFDHCVFLQIIGRSNIATIDIENTH